MPRAKTAADPSLVPPLPTIEGILDAIAVVKEHSLYEPPPRFYLLPNWGKPRMFTWSETLTPALLTPGSQGDILK